MKLFLPPYHHSTPSDVVIVVHLHCFFGHLMMYLDTLRVRHFFIQSQKNKRNAGKWEKVFCG